VASGGLYEGDIYVLSEADEWMASTAVARGAAAPAWSPDGSQIAFVSLSGDDGYHALHIMNPNGSGVREVTPRDEGGIERPTWSPDGRRIAFSKCIHGSCDVYAVAADGSTLTQLTRGMTAVGPAWSPDGDWIAFTTWSDWMDTARSIVIVPADAGGESFTVATAGTFPAWRP
jgi:TolB protein